MSRYTSLTPEDREQMLRTIEVDTLDELFDDIPDELMMTEPLGLAPGRGEEEVFSKFRRLSQANTSADDEVSFLGGGMYDHYVPAFITALMQRAEFLTPYTPYQPEASQGTLQLMFEFQTAMSELTGLPVSNATLYDGPSSVAAAVYLANLVHGVDRVMVSHGVHPHSRQALATTTAGLGLDVVEVPLADGTTDLASLAELASGSQGALVIQQPNFVGAVEDLDAIKEAAEGFEGSFISACDPIALGVLKTPGECGFDIAVGEGQPLGNQLNYGGPTFGYICAGERYMRKMPGRIAGETCDCDGRRAWCLTLQTREQHIRRENATSNITTAQTLNALGAITYLAWLGREGFVELAKVLAQRTNYLRERLAAIDGIAAIHNAPVIREFAVALDAPVERVVARCQEQGFNPGYPLGRDYPEFENGLLIALTESRARADLEGLAVVLSRAVSVEREVLAA